MRPILFISICFLVSYFVPAQCPNTCSPMAYEGFAYPNNTPLHGQFGGSGWALAWEVQDNRLTVPGYNAVSGTLAYSTLKSYQNSGIGGDAYRLMGRALDVSSTGVFANFVNSNGQIGKAGTSVWLSCVLKKKLNNDEEVRLHLHGGNTVWYAGNPAVGIGYFGTNSNTSGVRYWSLNINGTVYKTTVPVTQNANAFLVLKIDFSATATTYSLFVNPATLGSVTTPTPTLVQTVASSFQFKALATYLGDGSTGGALDEIRFADSWRCVAPDANVSENQQPVANFTASTISENAPFSVNFDGSSSTDPDGTLSNYQWTFSDGGTASGITPSYLFKNLGAISAVLTVTDNCGYQASKSINILVRDTNGNLPCFSTPTLNKYASCGQSNGQISISGGTNYVLRDAQNNTFPMTNNAFQNLASKAYTLTVTGNAGCQDVYNLQVPTDSNTCAGFVPRPYKLNMGIGLAGFNYYDATRQFKNFIQTASPAFTSAPGSWDTGKMTSIPVDTAGYPLQLPYTVDGVPQIVRIILSADKHIPQGRYVILYQGQGNFTLGGGATIISNTAGRTEIQLTTDGNFWMDINTSTLGNHLRGFKFLRIEDEFTDLATNPFYEKFLERACNFAYLRFMDWQTTNGSTLVNWADRSKFYFYTQDQGNKGVSYEMIIKLANILRKDIWINVPHQASDDYILLMARLFKQQLNPNLNVYLEYSNEVWNWQFSQAHWVDQNGPQNIAYPRKYALRALNVFKIWHNEWGTQKNRVKRVLATQSVYNWVGQNILAQANGEFDYFSPTFYFNYLDNGATGCVVGLRNGGTNTTARQILDCARLGFLTYAPNVKQNYLDAKMYGKAIAHYEGGQHMTSNPVEEPFQDSLYLAQIHPQMGVLYQEVIDSLKKWDTYAATPFVLTGGRISKYGSWGHLEFTEQDLNVLPAPKYQALLNNINPSLLNVCNANKMISVKTGNWQTATTWNWARKPKTSDEITIDNGHTVQIQTAEQVQQVILKGVLQYLNSGLLRIGN